MKLEKLLLLLSFSILLLFTVYGNPANAQLGKTIGIKITSPISGQQIPVGIKNFQILGTSSYNSTMKCQVSVIVDDVRPYQQAAAVHRGNYSFWNYTLSPQYTSIKQGINKLTAKLSCHDNSMNVTKFYSTNITGVPSSSKQEIINTSKSTVANQTKNETGKTANVIAASTVLQPLPNALTVNGILAKTGVLAAIQQQAVSQSNSSSTKVQSERLHRHQPSVEAVRTENSASFSVETPDVKHHPENTATPASNGTASNGTASNGTASNGTASNGTASNGTASNSIVSTAAMPSAANSTVGKVSIPSAASPSSSVRSNNSFLAPAYSFNNNHRSLQLPPIANAGPAQVVTGGSPVILNGSNSRAPTGTILSYSWMQIPTSATVTLSGVSTPVWEFTAPKVNANTLLRFQLTVTNNFGQSGIDTVNILDKTGTGSSTPIQPQIVRLPSNTASIPSINQNHVSNPVSIPNNNEITQPPMTPEISPPLTPPINSQLTP